MNTKHVIAAAAIAFLGSSTAFAQSSTDDLQHFGASQPSTVSRAEVRAEVQRAMAAGDLVTPSDVAATAVATRAKTPEVDAVRVAQKPQAAGKTRAEVNAELAQARADGSLTRPSDVNAFDNAVASTRTRDEVRKEAIAATRSGQAARVQAGY